MIENEIKYIHLLYVPTMACNMKCKYCYLEDNTKDIKTEYKSIDTLDYAIKKFKEKNVVPFNISLHGGEVTTLSKKEFHDLIQYIYNYYKVNQEIIKDGNFKLGDPHIKTNLYGIDKHLDTIKEFNVSISGSLDLPLSLHDEYRLTKGGEKTLDKILKNIELLRDIPNKKKVSATIFKQHFDKTDEIIDDIKFLDKNTCLNMNDFNFMIGFDYNSNGILTAMTENEQVEFFDKICNAFKNTNLEEGLNNAWFNEFGPEYCTNCDNCGTKFFLLEKNGDIYSCVRGQKNPDFYYGNIYKDSVEEILNKAQSMIFKAHNKREFNKECANCKYLYICKTGCPFVKNVYNSNKSYTCLLQKKLYKLKGYKEDEFFKESTYRYVTCIHPDQMQNYVPRNEVIDMPDLEEIISKDINLKYIYDNKSFILKIDYEEYNLESQILKKTREFVYLTPKSKIQIYVKKNVLDEVCDYPDNNAMYIQLLSGDMITYGDEGRLKQKHVANLMVYKNVLEQSKSDKKEYFKYDITSFIKEYSKYISKDKANNLFFTTTALRDYHYIKQKNNAFYHLQAINLPFQNIEFYYIERN